MFVDIKFYKGVICPIECVIFGPLVLVCCGRFVLELGVYMSDRSDRSDRSDSSDSSDRIVEKCQSSI